MSLSRDVRPPKGPGRRPRIEELYEELDPEDADTLRRWVGDLSFSPEFISRELKKDGVRCSPGAVAYWRAERLGIGERKR